MNIAVVATAASMAVLGAFAIAPTSASAQEVSVRHAVARMVVIVEDRTDIAVEIENGSANLPRPIVTRRGNDVRIDGDLGRNPTRECTRSNAVARQPGQGATVEVRRRGRVSLADAPLILVRTPRKVEVNIEDSAVYGAVGRGASSIELGNAGCGDWTVANTTGELELSVAGSGAVWAGTSRAVEVSLAGSGDISVGATRDLTVNIAGSGDITAARVDGPVEANIAGSGNVLVRGGNAGHVEANIAGSGDVRIEAAASTVEASIMGSGDVHVRSVSGRIDQSAMGSGRIIVGR